MLGKILHFEALVKTATGKIWRRGKVTKTLMASEGSERWMKKKTQKDDEEVLSSETICWLERDPWSSIFCLYQRNGRFVPNNVRLWPSHQRIKLNAGFHAWDDERNYGGERDFRVKGKLKNFLIFSSIWVGFVDVSGEWEFVLLPWRAADALAWMKKWRFCFPTVTLFARVTDCSENSHRRNARDSVSVRLVFLVHLKYLPL